jgi:hypothetical protein
MSTEEKYTREERLNDLGEYINAIPMEESTRDALIKQIAMVRCSDMEIANEADRILNLQLDVMRGAAVGEIS